MLYLKFNAEGQPSEYPLTEEKVRADLSHVTLAELTDASLAAHGYALLHPTSVTPPAPSKTHRVIVNGAEFDGEKWVRTYSSEEITSEQIKNLRMENKWKSIRQLRDHYMAMTEWRIQRNLRETRMGITVTEPIADLDALMQRLADVTNVDDPYLVNFTDVING
jgi:hypothetical protein